MLPGSDGARLVIGYRATVEVAAMTDTFQVTLEQAEMYERVFVPAIFEQWTVPLLDAAGVQPGHRLLDVACGPGVLARRAADRVGPTGRVVGLDLNEGMLTVARRLRPDLEWRLGDAAALPFPPQAFDAVLCQSALMFFPDATRALREMSRVCRVGGTVGVQVYAALDSQPGYGPWVDVVAQHAGREAVDLLGTYWVHGRLDALVGRFTAAGLDVVDVHTTTGVARWESVEQMVHIEISGTPLATRISDDVYTRILEDSRTTLAPHLSPDGVEVPLAAHLVIGRRA